MRTRQLLLVLALVVASTVDRAIAQTRPAVPLEPVAAILEAFRDHTIVALSEGNHNNEQSHRFRLALIRDPRFPVLVNDIVVESGSARYQDVIDRFIRGGEVPAPELRKVWQDTTQPDPKWDVPIYEEFFTAVRDINRSLPRDRQLRVLLGDPPIEWEKIRTREEWLGINRDLFAADLIQREVVSKRRRALLVFGGTHFLRLSPMGGSGRSSLIGGRLAAVDGLRVFSIWTHTSGVDLETLQADVASWPVPALALTANTTLGTERYSRYMRGGRGETGPRMDEQFDAVLYLGAVSSITYSRIAPSLCADRAYMDMRLTRLLLIDPPELPQPPGVVRPAEQLKQECAGATAK